MDMKVTVLGTGTSQGVPVISCTCRTCLSKNPKDKRLRCSVLIEMKELSIVIDSGPDFRQQMLSCGNQRLDALLITHEHNDHIIGLDDIRPYNFIQQSAIDVYAMPRVAKDIRNKFAYAFNNPYPGAPQIQLELIKEAAPFKIKEIEIIPIKVVHGNLNILGFRIKDFVYITDASFIAEEQFDLLKNVDVLIINALRREEHYAHFTLDQALAFIKKVNPQKAYLTHISHLLEPYNELEPTLPKNVHLAYDNFVFEL